VRLQDLPSKLSLRVLRSVTWTGIDRASSPHTPLRKWVERIARRSRRLVNLRTSIARLDGRP
jgi:hypothetical protein